MYHLEPKYQGWRCPSCNRRLSHRNSYCVWCGPHIEKPEVKNEPNPSESEIYKHLVELLRKIKVDIQTNRMRANQFGIHSFGLKHIEEEIGLCLGKLEKEL
jgi:hypothetical protein